MIQTIKNAWKIPELRKKIMFTIFALLIFRLGTAVPVPFVNTDLLGSYLNTMSDSIFGLMNAMSGGAFASATVFALGVQPYINSSIIIQLLTVAIPALERLQKEGGEEGRKKIAAITRYTTVGIALLQGFGYFTLLRVGTNGQSLLQLGDMNIVWAGIVIVLSFTAGSAFVMWLGEQITEFGIGNGISIILFAGIVGNGISIILFAGIVSRVPSMVQTMWIGVQASFLESPGAGTFVLPWWGAVLIVIGMLAIVVLIVFISNAERRLPVQYAKRMVACPCSTPSGWWAGRCMAVSPATSP